MATWVTMLPTISGGYRVPTVGPSAVVRGQVRASSDQVRPRALPALAYRALAYRALAYRALAYRALAYRCGAGAADGQQGAHGHDEHCEGSGSTPDSEHHPIRHGRSRELGAFANPKGRPRRKNSAIGNAAVTAGIAAWAATRAS
jgi:hypothetical protein